jgi:hypothetical protein
MAAPPDAFQPIAPVAVSPTAIQLWRAFELSFRFRAGQSRCQQIERQAAENQTVALYLSIACPGISSRN